MIAVVDDRKLIADHQALWSALNGFMGKFAALDWQQPHGKMWTFGEVPYHLTLFNNLIAEALRQGRNAPPEGEIRTIEQLNIWNDTNFQMRPTGQTGQQSFDQMRQSQDNLAAAVHDLTDPDQPVWLPILRVRGWRTARLAMEYSYWHTWLHFMEAHLRRDDHLPQITPLQMRRALDFDMEVTAGGVMPDRADSRFVWQLELDNSGQWIFDIGDGRGMVMTGHADKADVVMRTDIETYLRTSRFGMQKPSVALLTGKIRVKGLGKVAKLQRLFASTPDQVWQPMERGMIQP